MAALYAQIIEAALSGQPRSVENIALVTSRFSMLNEMYQLGMYDATKEQTIINELAITAAQWISTQGQVIKDLETKVDTITTLHQGRQGRQTESLKAEERPTSKCFQVTRNSSLSGLKSSSTSSQ